MLDIRQLRSDPQGVAGNLARRGYSLDLAQFTTLESRRKEAQIAVDQRLMLLKEQVVGFRPIDAADLVDIAETLRR